MAYPNDDLEPAGVMNEVLLIPPWAKQEHYGRLIAQLKRWGLRHRSARARLGRAGGVHFCV